MNVEALDADNHLDDRRSSVKRTLGGVLTDKCRLACAKASVIMSWDIVSYEILRVRVVYIT